MKFKSIFIIFFLITSCTTYQDISHQKKPYVAKGFAYIYSDKDYNEKIVKKKFDNSEFQIGHSKLRPGALIKIINLKTNDSIILKNTKKLNYPEFYAILITKSVAEKLNLSPSSPLVEILEVKKNKSFVAKKTKIYNEEKKIFSNAPVETVKIDNISKFKVSNKKETKEKFSIVIAEFYSINSAYLLKKRITKELTNFNSKKLFIQSNKGNKTTLLSGPYNSINLMKNDYIELKKFGFEELDLNIYE